MDIMKDKKISANRLLWFLLILAILVIVYLTLESTGLIDLLTDTEKFKIYVIQMGSLGVIFIICLMTFSILFKILPSAAVALASGAVYGHTWGTIYIIIGAWIGAMIAFSITRLLGSDALSRFSGRRIVLEQEKSQSWLMWGLFVSRLIPIIPYDIVSYAMGITPLKLWRFSIATLIGIIPTSFFLAHVGGELMETNFKEMLSGMMTASLFFLLPIVIAMVIFYRHGQFKNK